MEISFSPPSPSFGADSPAQPYSNQTLKRCHGRTHNGAPGSLGARGPTHPTIGAHAKLVSEISQQSRPRWRFRVCGVSVVPLFPSTFFISDTFCNTTTPEETTSHQYAPSPKSFWRNSRPVGLPSPNFTFALSIFVRRLLGRASF